MAFTAFKALGLCGLRLRFRGLLGASGLQGLRVVEVCDGM